MDLCRVSNVGPLLGAGNHAERKKPIKLKIGRRTQYRDQETGWLVVIEPDTDPKSPWSDGIKQTIVNETTGETVERTLWTVDKSEKNQTNVAEWLSERATRIASDLRLKENVRLFLHATYPELAAGESIPNGPLGRIKLSIATDFAHWKFCLPEENVIQRKRGRFFPAKSSWIIDILFGQNEKGEYLDCFAVSHMTNERHYRVYETGEEESLPNYHDYCGHSDDPIEQARLNTEHDAHNRAITKLLEEKGFM